MAEQIDTRDAPSAHEPNSTLTRIGTFDPADWLARYTALGGVYVANGKLNLCILVNKQTDEQLSQIRQMVVDLTDERRATILAYLNNPGATAQDALDRYWHAFHAYNVGQLDDEAYLAAFAAMWAWTPTTARDFTRKYEAAWTVGGCPTEEHHAKMMADAIAILGPDARSGEA